MKRLASVVAVLAMATGLTACAQPDYRYASEDPGSAPAGPVYFKVPYSWTPFSASDISTAQSGWSADQTTKSLLDATTWQAAYDASPRPSLANVLGRKTPEAPTLYASLRTLYGAETSGATAEALRNLVVPVGTLGDAVHVDDVKYLDKGNLRGIHVIFSYRPVGGTVDETVDQTAYYSQGDDAVYLLVIRCSSSCYTKNKADIDAVTASYTLQEATGG